LFTDYTVKGASDVLEATFYQSGVKGHAKTTTSNKVSYGGYGSWSTTADASGGKVKNDFLKISNVAGNVKLTVEWAMNSKQTAGNRNLEVTIGDSEDATCETVACNAEKGAQTAFTKTFNAGTGTNIYIGASNEICLVSVKIEAAE